MQADVRDAWARVRAYNNGWNHGHIIRATATPEELAAAQAKAWRDYLNASDSIEARYYFGVRDGLAGHE